MIWIDNRCPIEGCRYGGDTAEHYKLLGIKPYWCRGMKLEPKFDKDSDGKYTTRLRLYSTDACVVCLDNRPNIVYSGCRHNIICCDCILKMDDYYKCPMCRCTSRYVFPCAISG